VTKKPKKLRLSDLQRKRQGDTTRGLSCPKCGCGHFLVVYTRPSRGSKIMRRRECRNCGRRITTFEA